VNARHFDVLTADTQSAGDILGVHQDQVDHASFGALQQVGGLIGRQFGRGLPVDFGDLVAGMNARPFGGAAGDDFDDLQGTGGTLELDAQADKVPFDLRIDVC